MRDTLEAKDFRLGRSKTNYLESKCSEEEGGIEDEMTIRGVAIPSVEKF